ncbi:hypothetical protein [Methanococcoides alaskense]|uniref:Uncharacterized protein n=1 Tax=Methanococcoides alaskense TaxID=325778 RepID=A0AA90Z892_9EURY|nr:hypothetical protein [Methanococcoides alaskense]MDA0524722.1 hypothetical protein [Methanococcoides alaskense]MDR6223160.1 hypothetical protein [Methanococcoides alaskense]
MDLLKNSKNKLTLAELKKAELEAKSFNLGLEVGYNKHSEIGWVKENLVKLENLSKSLGLGDVISAQYLYGKLEGALAREKGLKIDAFQKAEQNEGTSVTIDLIAGPEKEVDTGFRNHTSKDELFAPVGRPKFLSSPECTSLTKAIDRPTSMDGFKPLRPRK